MTSTDHTGYLGGSHIRGPQVYSFGILSGMPTGSIISRNQTRFLPRKGGVAKEGGIQLLRVLTARCFPLVLGASNTWSKHRWGSWESAKNAPRGPQRFFLKRVSPSARPPLAVGLFVVCPSGHGLHGTEERVKGASGLGETVYPVCFKLGSQKGQVLVYLEGGIHKSITWGLFKQSFESGRRFCKTVESGRPQKWIEKSPPQRGGRAVLVSLSIEVRAAAHGGDAAEALGVLGRGGDPKLPELEQKLALDSGEKGRRGEGEKGEGVRGWGSWGRFLYFPGGS